MNKWLKKMFNNMNDDVVEDIAKRVNGVEEEMLERVSERVFKKMGIETETKKEKRKMTEMKKRMGFLKAAVITVILLAIGTGVVYAARKYFRLEVKENQYGMEVAIEREEESEEKIKEESSVLSTSEEKGYVDVKLEYIPEGIIQNEKEPCLYSTEDGEGAFAVILYHLQNNYRNILSHANVAQTFQTEKGEGLYIASDVRWRAILVFQDEEYMLMIDSISPSLSKEELIKMVENASLIWKEDSSDVEVSVIEWTEDLQKSYDSYLQRMTEEIMLEDFNEDGEVDVWDKIVGNVGMGIKGVHLYEPEQEFLQDNWSYKVNSAFITKHTDSSWDGVPDYFEYDEKNDITNGYSYFVVNMSITCVKENTLVENKLWLNHIWLGVFDENGDKVDGSEACTTSSGNNYLEKDYFSYVMQKGDSLTADIVYVIKDDVMSDENYYILEVNNHGVLPSDASEFSIIKILPER